MKNLIVLFVLGFSLSSWAGESTKMRAYNCQLSQEKGTGCNEWRYTIPVYGKSFVKAVRECSAEGKKRNSEVCRLAPVSAPQGLDHQFSFACQMAEMFCAKDGGRYSVLMTGNSKEEAQAACEKAAEKNGDFFCQVSKFLPLEKAF